MDGGVNVVASNCEDNFGAAAVTGTQPVTGNQVLDRLEKALSVKEEEVIGRPLEAPG